MTSDQISYNFLINVLSDTEISEETKCAYPWLFNVEFLLTDQESGQEIYTTENYYAINSKVFDQVEKKWRWNNSLNIGGAELLDITLQEYKYCNSSSLLN
jgi:hypothetical protein